MLIRNTEVKSGHDNRGQLTIQLLIFGSIAVIILSGFLVWLDTVTKTVVRGQDRAQALGIAEAGIEYYRWRLAHFPTDYEDGTTSTGPYAHNYYDKNGNFIGQFILDITPPPLGSKIVTIQSTGKVASDPTVEKIIRVKMGIPSFAKFSVVSNDNLRFGQGSEVFGPIHSNGGIHFDGLAHNSITSALVTYDDPDHSNPSGEHEYAVHTHINPPPATGVDDAFRPLESPPNPLPNRPDVFMAGRAVGVPAVDFTGITQNVAAIRDESKVSGFYAPTSTTGLGYEVVLKTDNTFDLYTVTSIAPPPPGCTNVSNVPGWGSWSVGSETLINTYPIPANGLIFLEDNVWIRGQINNSRVTIASGKFPDNSATRTNIMINENLTYTNYDGRDVIGLIAQQDIIVGLYSADVLRIDAGLMAQNGRVVRFYYRPPSQEGNNINSRCSPWHVRQEITVYGMIASNIRYGFAYADFGGENTGYLIRNLIYDSNLLYGPPPSFPLVASSYETISWEEIK